MNTPPKRLNRLAREEVNEAGEGEMLRVAHWDVGVDAQQFDEAVAR